MKPVIIMLLLLFVALPVMAQDDRGFVDAPIQYDQTVAQGITNDEFFDWYRLQATAGDIIFIEMQAADGLAPLIGLLDPALELVARSDEGEPDGIVSMEYTASESGEYTIVATRAGRDTGTTTGTYALIVSRVGGAAAPTPENPYTPVVLPCGDYEMTTAVQLRLTDDGNQVDYFRISIYGLDGFNPVIHLVIEDAGLTDCSQDAAVMPGDSVTLPAGLGGDSLTLPADTPAEGRAAQLRINSAAQLGSLVLTLGSRDGAAGRYVALIQGFTIGVEDLDTLELRLGPLARDTALYVYMLADPTSRLDPFMQLLPEDSGISCDDAGRRGCETTPVIDGFSAFINADDGWQVTGGRFDAGLMLTPGSPDPLEVQFGSFRGSTTGGYTLLLVGELPPRPPASG